MACLIFPLDSTNLEKYLAHSRHPKHTSCLNRGMKQQEKVGNEASTFSVQSGSEGVTGHELKRQAVDVTWTCRMNQGF